MSGNGGGMPRWGKRLLFAVVLVTGIGCALFARAYYYESTVCYASEALVAVGLASIRYQQETRS